MRADCTTPDDTACSDECGGDSGDVPHVVALCRIAFPACLDEMARMTNTLNVAVCVTTPVVYPVQFGGDTGALRVVQRADPVWPDVIGLERAACLGVAAVDGGSRLIPLAAWMFGTFATLRYQLGASRRRACFRGAGHQVHTTGICCSRAWSGACSRSAAVSSFTLFSNAVRHRISATLAA